MKLCGQSKFVYDCKRDAGHTGIHFDWDNYATNSIGGREWEDGEEGESWLYDVLEWPEDAVRNMLAYSSDRIKNHIKEHTFGQQTLPLCLDLQDCV